MKESEQMKVGDKYNIHCYKHNGEAYQASDDTIILDIQDDFIVCGNYMVLLHLPYSFHTL